MGDLLGGLPMDSEREGVTCGVCTARWPGPRCSTQLLRHHEHDRTVTIGTGRRASSLVIRHGMDARRTSL
jgi:hypothetical protein